MRDNKVSKEKERNQGWEYYGAGVGGWGAESDWRCKKCGKIVPYCKAQNVMCLGDHR